MTLAAEPPRFRDWAIPQMEASGIVPSDFQRQTIEDVTIEWDGRCFRSFRNKWREIAEIYFEYDFHVSQELAVSKFRLVRADHATRTIMCRTVDQITLRLYVQSYATEADMQKRAAEHIPVLVGNGKVATFALSRADDTDIRDTVAEALANLPECLFSRTAGFRSKIIPALEYLLLRQGCVVFEARLNKFTKFTKPMIWPDAINLQAAAS